MASVNSKNRMTKAFFANSPIIFTLPLGGKILQGWVALIGTVVVTGGTTNGTLMGEGGPSNLIKRIKITATPASGSRYPGGNIVDCTSRSLLRYAIYQRGKFVAEQSGNPLGNGAAGTYDIALYIPIFFADSNLRNEMATALNTDPGVYASVQVRVDTGDLTSCFTGNDRTANWSGLTLQWIDNRMGLAGDTLVRYQEDHMLLIPATQERALDEAMPNDGAFESWLFLQEQGVQDSLTNNLLQRVTVDSPTLSYDKWAPDIYQDMLDNGLIDASQNQSGQLFIDFTNGILANTVAAGPIQAYYQVTNVSGANLDDLRIFTRRVFAPLPANK